MPTIDLKREIEIAKDPQFVVQYLANFQNWPIWSPWLILQPDCVLEYSGVPSEVGSRFRWDGQLVGAGQMTLIDKQADRLEMQLVFQKPFRSKARVVMHLRLSDHGCIVKWSMHTNLPWFLFFLKPMMMNTIGLDYERGLKMLKSQLELDAVHSHLEILGEQTLPAINYIGIPGQGLTQQLGLIVHSDFCRLSKKMKELDLEACGSPFVLYNRMNLSSNRHELITAIPISSPAVVEPPFICDSLPAKPAYTVRHTGSYSFVGNAWALAINSARTKKIKLLKQPFGIERYLNDPQQVEAKDLITEISVFCR